MLEILLFNWVVVPSSLHRQNQQNYYSRLMTFAKIDPWVDPRLKHHEQQQQQHLSLDNFKLFIILFFHPLSNCEITNRIASILQQRNSVQKVNEKTWHHSKTNSRVKNRRFARVGMNRYNTHLFVTKCLMNKFFNCKS